MKQSDTFTDYTLTAAKECADGFELSAEGGWGFYLQKQYGAAPHGIQPKAGDTARLYGKGFGYVVRGVDINGAEAFYRTEEQQEAEGKRQAEEADEKRRAEFERDRPRLDKQYAALPPAFQARVDRFRRNAPEFRWRMERYELLCCSQAVVIANRLRGADLRDQVPHIPDWAQKHVKGREGDPFAVFANLPFERQKALVPELDEGHSGNSFGCSVMLARIYAEDPNHAAIRFGHGALCPLVGCADYGCHPFTADEEAELKAFAAPAPAPASEVTG